MLATHPSITLLLVDDNRDTVRFLGRLLESAGLTIISAESASEARRLAQEQKPDAALLDYMLPDGNGVELGVEFLRAHPDILVVIMSGSNLPAEEEALCEEHNFAVLHKPFLASDVLNQIRTRLVLRLDTEIAFTAKALKVFFCYSHRDEKLRDRLDAQLAVLKHMNIIHSWHDRRITAGTDFNEAIDKYLNSADLILLLVSPDFLSSEYCYRVEMKRALERHERGEARVIPVILRPADWGRHHSLTCRPCQETGRPSRCGLIKTKASLTLQDAYEKRRKNCQQPWNAPRDLRAGSEAKC